MRFDGTAMPYGYHAPYRNVSPEAEKQALQSQADALQTELDSIKKRLSELETGTAAE